MFSNLLIWLIVLFLPTQLGLHFWPSFARVSGIKIDYLSPTLYLIDPLILFLLIDNFVSLAWYFKRNIYDILLVVSFITINTLYSVSPLNTFFWWLRFALYILLFITFCIRRLKWSQVCKPLLYGTTIVVVIEVCQLYLQSSVGGPLYFLGERAYSASTSGIGRLNLLGLEILRPESIFSHPNSLAGYLLVVFYLFAKKPSKSWYKLVPFLGIIITFSKTAIFSLALVIFNIRPQFIILISIILTYSQPLVHNFRSEWQSLSDRQFFLPYLKNIYLHNPLTGSGLGGFIPSLGNQLPGSYTVPSKLQPIHNLPLLMLAEVGLLGTLILTVTVIKQKTLKFLSNPTVLGLLAIVLITGVFDHYTWTLPQNRLIFLLALSIML